MILAIIGLAWLLGVAAAAFSDADPAATFAAAGLFGVLSFAIRPRWSTLALVAAGFVIVLIAGWRYEATIPQPAPIARFNEGEQIRLRGVVSDEPQERGNSRMYRIDVRESRIDDRWRRDDGDILVRAPLFPEYKYGDLLEIRGELEPPPTFEDFDYRDYLVRRGIVSIAEYPAVRVLEHGRGNFLRSASIDVRSALTDSLSNILPDPQASLAAGILFGARSEIPRDLRDDMEATGTSHLVAVSGQNVVLLAALLIAALAWIVGRRPAAWAALGGVVVYAFLVGGQPSVVRAAIMGGLYVVAMALGRQNAAIVAIALAAAGMTALNPQVAHDVSFQLSFAATLGLIVLTPLLLSAIDNLSSRWPAAAEFPLARMFMDVATMTLAATAFTWPIIAINFQRVSLASPVANLFAVPAFVAVAATSAIAALAGLVLPGDAGFMAWGAWPPAAFMTGIIQLFADLPLASVELRGLQIHVEHAVAYYAALGAAIWWLTKQAITRIEMPPPPPLHPPRRLLPAGALALLLVLASGLLWLALSAPAGGRLTVTFLDVGQGDAILIEGPEGHRVLVDGGPSGEAISAALGRHLPFYDRRLDLVVLTHPQQDHLGGLPQVLEDFSVGRVISSAERSDTAAYEAWQNALNEQGITTTDARRGQTIDLRQSAVLSVLAPGPEQRPRGQPLNDASVVLRVTMGGLSFLLTGDISEEGEAALVRTGVHLDSVVLKVAHHGSRTSTSEAFLSRATPNIDVISVAGDNPYGHPTNDVLDRLAGDIILRTDAHGDITLSTDGKELWVQTQRSAPTGAPTR